MRLKTFVKTALFGKPGLRPRKIRAGLLRGQRFMIDTSNRSMRLVGLDETELAAATRDLTRGAVAAVDVGANDGWYAVYFASRPHVQRLYAFEPQEVLAHRFRENLALNGETVAAKAIFVGKLVGDRDDAEWCRLDTTLAGVNGPMVIKIDVEGGELDVLKGAQRTLTANACGLVIETHSEELERQCARFLQSIGYHTKIIKKGWYRALFPEERHIPHNQWLIAWKPR
jgi:hypothetical protein